MIPLTGTFVDCAKTISVSMTHVIVPKNFFIFFVLKVINGNRE